VCEKFSLKSREYLEEVLEDFMEIDYSLIVNAIG